MKKIAIITLDTEPDCDTKWVRSNPLTFNSVTVGVQSLLQPLFDIYGVRPVYFVSPEVTEHPESVAVLKQISDDGRCEIGNHLHGEYVEPEKEFDVYDGSDSNAYACFDYSDEVEFEKIKNYDARLTHIFGKKPTSFRAARYGADSSTIRSLMKLGYTVDSSVTPNIDWSYQRGPNFKGYLDQPYWVDHTDFSKEDENSSFLEVPITIGQKRLPFLPDKWLFYRWLRPTHMTVWEQKRLINDFMRKNKDKDHVVLCLMFHSMEVIPGATPFVRSWFESRLFMRRLEKTIQYLQKQGFEFHTLAESQHKKV